MQNAKCRMQNEGRGAVRKLMPSVIAFGLALMLVRYFPGCMAGTASTQPTSLSDRQDAALKDPMNYKPNFNTDTHSDVGSFDQQGFNRDMNDFINP